MPSFLGNLNQSTVDRPRISRGLGLPGIAANRAVPEVGLKDLSLRQCALLGGYLLALLLSGFATYAILQGGQEEDARITMRFFGPEGAKKLMGEENVSSMLQKARKDNPGPKLFKSMNEDAARAAFQSRKLQGPGYFGGEVVLHNKMLFEFLKDSENIREFKLTAPGPTSSTEYRKRWNMLYAEGHSTHLTYPRSGLRCIHVVQYNVTVSEEFEKTTKAMTNINSPFDNNCYTPDHLKLQEGSNGWSWKSFNIKDLLCFEVVGQGWFGSVVRKVNGALYEALLLSPDGDASFENPNSAFAKRWNERQNYPCTIVSLHTLGDGERYFIVKYNISGTRWPSNTLLSSKYEWSRLPRTCYDLVTKDNKVWTWERSNERYSTVKHQLNPNIRKQIGDGTYGTIYQKPTDESRAIKIYNNDAFSSKDCAKKHDMFQSLEIALGLSLEHGKAKRFVKYHKLINPESLTARNTQIEMSYLDRITAFGGDAAASEEPIFCMNYVKEGDDSKQKKYKKFVGKYFHDLLEGLNFLHPRGVVHRDLKPENTLLGCPRSPQLTETGSKNKEKQFHELIDSIAQDPSQLEVTIIDLDGLAYGVSNGSHSDFYNPKSYSGCDHIRGASADLFSVGIMLYEFLAFRAPDAAFKENQINNDLKKYPETVEFIKKLLGFNAPGYTARDALREWEVIVEMYQ